MKDKHILEIEEFGDKSYTKNGVSHNENGPSSIYFADDDVSIKLCYCYLGSMYHSTIHINNKGNKDRLMIYDDGYKRYFNNN